MSLRAIAWQPRRLHIERDEVASLFLLAMTPVRILPGPVSVSILNAYILKIKKISLIPIHAS